MPVCQLIPLYGLEELAKRLPHDPRDLHLGNPEAAADLALLEVVLEAKPKHGALALCELGSLGRELNLDPLIAGLLSPHRLDYWLRLFILAAPQGVKREGAARGVRHKRLQDLLLGELEALRDLRDGRSPAQCIGDAATASRTTMVRSWSLRGSRRSQTRSLKCRRSSPRIVGAA